MTRFHCVLLIAAALGAGTACDAAASQPVAAPTAAAPEARSLPPGRVEIALEDLHCGSCAKKVARKLYALKGVRKVETYLKADLVVVYLPAKQAVEPVTLWQATLAGGVKPTELRFANQRFDAVQMADRIRTAGRPNATH